MTRTVTVYNSSTQEKRVLQNVEASTLADLKALFRENNIDYTDMDFMEGVSQTKLISDNSILPHDIPFRGQTTNDLLIYMTLKDKKVRSGVDVSDMDRKSLLNYIKEQGWAEEVNAEYGQNYTRLPSAFLVEFCEKKAAPASTPAEPAPAEESSCNCAKAISVLLNILYDNDCITDSERCRVLAALNSAKDDEGGFSMEDIHSMMPVLED